MIDFIVEPFRSDFMQNGALMAAIVGILSSIVGCFIVIKRMSLLADSFAHGILPGIAIVMLLTTTSNQPSSLLIFIGALVGSLVTALLSLVVLRKSKLQEDTAVAVVFVFMLALGVLLISKLNNYAVDLTVFMFGDILSVSREDIILTAAASSITITLVILFYRKFALIAFNKTIAAALGVNTAKTEALLMALVAFAVVIGFKAVGALLVLGMLIAPPATAAIFTKSLPSMMASSAAIAVVCGPIGLLLSWHLDVAVSSAIVLTATAVFICATLASNLLHRHKS